VSVASYPRRAAASVLASLLLLVPAVSSAGGPKYVAGVSFFNPGVVGQPVRWAGGQVQYYVDQGPLNGSVTNQQATAMVDAAAALWSAVSTAGVTLVDKGPLNENVSGSNIVAVTGQITQPADVTPAATNYPLAVIYDADGSVIDAIFGSGASQPTSCQNNGVWVWMDNINPDATIAHGVIVLNGLCATNSNLLTMMSYELERAFGRILGLDYAQVNPGAAQNGEVGGTLGWPVMHPLSGNCRQGGGVCIPNPSVLRFDDIAALNRIYPIAAANLSSFPGKQITAANTVSIQGTISFRTGVGMQGVNVVARPLDASGNPLYQYAVSFVSGSYYNGNHGNPVTGWTDTNGKRLDRWGSNDASLQGFFDLRGIPLPPGMTTANYQISFEAIDPLYILADSVGPYIDGQPTPSGTLQTISVPGMSAGMSQTLTVNVIDSAVGGYQDAIGTQALPRILPPSGMWYGRLSQVGQSDWFSLPVRGNRTFTVVTQALDETDAPTEITAIAPAAASGVTGSVDVEVDDLPIFYAAAVITGGISYDSGTGDALTLLTAPANSVPVGVPLPFSVTALGPDLTAAGGVTVIYAVTGGTATLSCGLPICTVVTTGDGRATMNVTAVDETLSIVTASLTNGSSLQAHFSGGTPPVLSALSPQLSLSAGATFSWTVQALVLRNGVPLSGQSVAWHAAGSGITPQGSAAAITSSSGIATKTLTVGPLTEGQMVTATACLNGTSQCVTYTAFGARPEYAILKSISGTTQSMAVSGTPSQIALRLLDMNGNPMAGGTVNLIQALYAWAPPCAPHGRCAQAELLATQAASATSALDGTVVFTPASLPGVATNLLGLAVSGNTASVNVSVERHP